MNEIAQHKIKIYEFPEADDEEENRLQKKLKVPVCVRFRRVILLFFVLFVTTPPFPEHWYPLGKKNYRRRLRYVLD